MVTWGAVLCLVLAGLLLAAVKPAGALAGSVSIGQGSKLVWGAASGETNNVQFRVLTPALFTVVDTGALLFAGVGCTQVDQNTAHCLRTGVTSLKAIAGNGDDAVDAFSIPVPVEIEAGTGNDILHGGDGDDSLTDSFTHEDLVGFGENVLGGNDTMYGNGGNDLLDGATGNDTLNGGRATTGSWAATRA